LLTWVWRPLGVLPSQGVVPRREVVDRLAGGRQLLLEIRDLPLEWRDLVVARRRPSGHTGDERAVDIRIRADPHRVHHGVRRRADD